MSTTHFRVTNVDIQSRHAGVHVAVSGYAAPAADGISIPLAGDMVQLDHTQLPFRVNMTPVTPQEAIRVAIFTSLTRLLAMDTIADSDLQECQNILSQLCTDTPTPRHPDGTPIVTGHPVDDSLLASSVGQEVEPTETAASRYRAEVAALCYAQPRISWEALVRAMRHLNFGLTAVERRDILQETHQAIQSSASDPPPPPATVSALPRLQSFRQRVRDLCEYEPGLSLDQLRTALGSYGLHIPRTIRESIICEEHRQSLADNTATTATGSPEYTPRPVRTGANAIPLPEFRNRAANIVQQYRGIDLQGLTSRLNHIGITVDNATRVAVCEAVIRRHGRAAVPPNAQNISQASGLLGTQQSLDDAVEPIRLERFRGVVHEYLEGAPRGQALSAIRSNLSIRGYPAHSRERVAIIEEFLERPDRPTFAEAVQSVLDGLEDVTNADPVAVETAMRYAGRRGFTSAQRFVIETLLSERQEGIDTVAQQAPEPVGAPTTERQPRHIRLRERSSTNGSPTPETIEDESDA